MRSHVSSGKRERKGVGGKTKAHGNAAVQLPKERTQRIGADRGNHFYPFDSVQKGDVMHDSGSLIDCAPPREGKKAALMAPERAASEAGYLFRKQ